MLMYSMTWTSWHSPAVLGRGFVGEGTKLRGCLQPASACRGSALTHCSPSCSRVQGASGDGAQGRRRHPQSRDTLMERRTQCWGKEVPKHGWRKIPKQWQGKAVPDCVGAEMPGQGQKRDTEAGTPVRGLEPMEEPMPKLVTKKQEATKSKELLTPAHPSPHISSSCNMWWGDWRLTESKGVWREAETFFLKFLMLVFISLCQKHK